MGYFYQLLAMAGWDSSPGYGRSVADPVMMRTADPIGPPINGRILSWLITHSQL